MSTVLFIEQIESIRRSRLNLALSPKILFNTPCACSFNSLKFLFFIALIVFSNNQGQAQTITWIGAGDGINWSDNDNWDLDMVPSSSSDVVIPNGQRSRVNAAFNVNSILIQSNATLELNSTLTALDVVSINAGGFLDWSIGSFSTGVIENQGTILINSSSSKNLLNGAVINNSNTMLWLGAGLFTFNGASINNGGLIDLQTGSVIQETGDGGQINNQGTFRKSTGGSSGSFINLSFINDGEVDLQVGTLTMRDSELMDGSTYNVEPDASLELTSNSIFDGVISSDIAGKFVVTGIISVISSATFDFRQNGIGLGQVTINGGGTLTNDGIINIETSSSKTLLGNTTVVNNGVINWRGTGLFTFNSGTIDNTYSGVIDLQVGSVIQQTGEGGTINNQGVIRKSTDGSIDSRLSMNFINTGTLEVQLGTLTFSGLATLNQGAYQVAEGSLLEFTSNTTLENSISSDIEGDMTMTGTLQITSSPEISFTGAGLNLASITITGGGTLTNNETLNITTSSSKSFIGNTTIDNTGNMNWTGIGLFTANDGVINNRPDGIIDLQVGSVIQQTGSGGVLNNEGILRKSSDGSSTSTISLQVVNTGTLEVETGVLSFNGLITLDGGEYVVDEEAVLQSISTTTLQGDIVSSLDGEFVLSGSLQVPTTASINFQGEGLNFSFGSISGGGTLTNEGVLNFISTSSKNFIGNTTLENNSIVNWLGEGLFTFNDGIINNTSNGLIDLKVGSVIQQTGSGGVINNSGTLRKSSDGTNTSNINLPIVNTGVIEVQTGEIRINSSFTLDEGTYLIAEESTLSATNVTTFADDVNSELVGQFNITGILQILDTVSIDFEGAGFNLPNTTITGGGLLINEGILNFTTSSSKSILGGTVIENHDRINSIGTGLITINNGTINNRSDGLIDLQIGSVIQQTGSGGIINNNGILRKSTDGNVTSNINLPIVNNGELEVQIGLLNLNGQATFDGGLYSITRGATLASTSSTTLTGNISGDPEGSLNITGTLLIPDSADINFGGSGVNLGAIVIRGGGVLTNSNRLNITTTSSKSLIENTTINNDGIMNWEGTGLFTFNAGVINNNNNGLVNLQIGSVIQQTGAGGIINNNGIFQKSTNGSNASFINLPFVNDGTTSVLLGSLVFNSTFDNQADGRVEGVSVIDPPALSSFTNTGTYAPGTSPGRLTVDGDFEMEQGGTLEFELNGLTPSIEHDVLDISGNADLDGDVQVIVGFEPVVNDEFEVLTTGGTVRTCNLPSQVTSNIFGMSRYLFDVLCNSDNITLRLVEIITLLPPIADNDTASIAQSGTVLIELIDGDSDPDGALDISSLTIITPPQNGVVVNNVDGTVSYTHDGSQVDRDSFTYQISDLDGLISNIATVDLFIEIDPVEVEIEIFNAVSPNGDLNNDHFHIENIEFFENNQLEIFNRWGDLVYDAIGYNNQDVSFRGRSNRGGNGELPTGTYFYQLNLGDGSPTRTGYLQLKY